MTIKQSNTGELKQAASTSTDNNLQLLGLLKNGCIDNVAADDHSINAFYRGQEVVLALIVLQLPAQCNNSILGTSLPNATMKTFLLTNTSVHDLCH